MRLFPVIAPRFASVVADEFRYWQFRVSESYAPQFDKSNGAKVCGLSAKFVGP